MSKHNIKVKKYTQNQVFFYIILSLITYLSFIMIKPYLLAIMLSFITVIVLMPVYRFFLNLFRNKVKLASTLSVLVLLFTLIIPVALSGLIIVNQVNVFVKDLDTNQLGDTEIRAIDTINDTLTSIGLESMTFTKEQFNDSIIEGVKSLTGTSGNVAASFSSGLAQFSISMFLYIFLSAIFFSNYDNILKYIKKLSPLDDHVDDLFISRFIAMAKSMLLGTFAIAAIQTIITAISFHITGVSNIAFWSFIVFIISLVPMIGSTLVVIPIGGVMYALGDSWQGLFLIAINLLLTVNVDNALRPFLVNKKAKLHPGLMAIGIIGGISFFGIWGFLFGPIVMILFATAIEVYLKYFNN